MNKQSLIDSLPVGPRVTDGKDPMRDLSIVGGRRPRPVAKPDDADEIQLARVFRSWMKHPTTPQSLKTLSAMMLAHEIRAYNAASKTK